MWGWGRIGVPPVYGRNGPLEVELLVGPGKPRWGRWYWLDPTAVLLIAIVIAYCALATDSDPSWLTIFNPRPCPGAGGALRTCL
jgi:hypothetical protein